MASRKMTFTIPEEVAAVLQKRIPARDRSRYVSEAIVSKLKERDEAIIRACEVANADPEVHAIEREWESLIDDEDRVKEPWSNPATR